MSEPQRVIKFMSLRRHGAVFSIVLSIVSIVSFFWHGLNYGLDFTGGTLVEVQFSEPVVAEDVRISLEHAGINEAVVQHLG
jgi:preprotein translocase subunit SecF